MATPEQLKANSENAQKSCGPKTEEGKQASSQNATKHGLSGHTHFAMFPDEDINIFRKLHDNLKLEHRPQTQSEIDIVYRMAQHEWLRARAIRMQNHCFSQLTLVDSKKFATLLRYQVNAERAYSQCLKDLATLRAERKNAEFGFVPQIRQAAADARAERLLNLREKQLELDLQRFQYRKSRATTPETTPETAQAPDPNPGGLAAAA